MLSGWIKGTPPIVDPGDLLIIDPHPGLVAQSLIELGVSHFQMIPDQLHNTEYLILAIKPQGFQALSEQIAGKLTNGCVVISIMAGITLAQLRDAFPEQYCVRAMPNTPASIGAGITGFVTDKSLGADQSDFVKTLLSSTGSAIEVKSEIEIDMVTAISGSGPAYFFYLVEALSEAGEKLGLSKEQASQLAHQTLIGAGALLAQSGETAENLRKAVTSPNGTTQAALERLMGPTGLDPAVEEAVKAAFDRSVELGNS